MKKFKLKEESKKYFSKKLGEQIAIIDFWEYKGIDLEALEEVPSMRIEYGIDHYSYIDMCRWANNEGGRFNFTIVIPNINMREYNNIKEHIPALMEELENTAKSFIENLK